MRRKAIAILILAALMTIMVFLGACVDSPSAKRIDQAAERVKQETVAEKELLYDNGKNFLVVLSNDWAVAVVVLQQWCDQHPDKRLSAISSDSIGLEGIQSVFIAYYYEVKEGR